MNKKGRDTPNFKKLLNGCGHDELNTHDELSTALFDIALTEADMGFRFYHSLYNFETGA